MHLVCLAVACHPHVRQNDQDLLRVTAVTRLERIRNYESTQVVEPGEYNSQPLLNSPQNNTLLACAAATARHRLRGSSVLFVFRVKAIN